MAMKFNWIPKERCMEMKMNKRGFIKNLSAQSNLSEQEAILVNDILENNFFISKKNKDKIISEIVIKLGVTLEEATKIYDMSKSIMKEEIKSTLKCPFKSKD